MKQINSNARFKDVVPPSEIDESPPLSGPPVSQGSPFSLEYSMTSDFSPPEPILLECGPHLCSYALFAKTPPLPSDRNILH